MSCTETVSCPIDVLVPGRDWAWSWVLTSSITVDTVLYIDVFDQAGNLVLSFSSADAAPDSNLAIDTYGDLDSGAAGRAFLSNLDSAKLTENEYCWEMRGEVTSSGLMLHIGSGRWFMETPCGE